MGASAAGTSLGEEYSAFSAAAPGPQVTVAAMADEFYWIRAVRAVRIEPLFVQ